MGEAKPRLADDSHSLCRKEQNVSKEVEKEIEGHREVPQGPRQAAWVSSAWWQALQQEEQWRTEGSPGKNERKRAIPRVGVESQVPGCHLEPM